MRLVAYCRVSTEKEAQLDSLEKQKEYFEEFAKNNGHTLARIYADEGISGKQRKNRTEFNRMMADSRLGLFDLVAVKDISRFARNTVDFLTAIRELRGRDIEVLFISNNQSIIGNSEFVLTIFSALAQEESAGLSKRIKFGKSVTAQKGRVPNLVYGYTKGEDRYTLTVNREEAEAVRNIFSWYVFDGLGATKIAQKLNQSGVVSKRGKQWSQVAITRMLSNPLYIGKVANHKSEIKDFITGERREFSTAEWVVVDKPELAIIAPEVFERAQRISKSRASAFQNHRERHSNQYPLSTLIRCGCCGYSYRRLYRKFQYGEYVKWICSNRNARGVDGCANRVMIDEDGLMEELRGYIRGIVKDWQGFTNDCLCAFQRLSGQVEHSGQNKAQLAAAVKKLKRQKEKYLEMYAMDVIDAEELKEKTAGLNLQIARQEKQLEAEESGVAAEGAHAKRLSDLFQSPERLISFEFLSNADMKSVFDRMIACSDGKVEIYLKNYADFSRNVYVPVRNNGT